MTFFNKKAQKEFVTEYKSTTYWNYKGKEWNSTTRKKLEKPILYENFDIVKIKTQIRDKILKDKDSQGLFGYNAYMKNFNFKNVEWFIVELKEKDIITEMREVKK